MEPAKSFTDLIVWWKGHRFVLEVYRLTAAFPKSEIYGLASQFRRAAISIPANIAEGFRKQSPQDKTRFLNIAGGSLEECRYYLILHATWATWTTKRILNKLKKSADFYSPIEKRYSTKDSPYAKRRESPRNRSS